MFESLSQRTMIIGNSGAGKSALAESLAASIHVPVIDLDLLNWEGSSARIRWGRRRGSHAAAANPSLRHSTAMCATRIRDRQWCVD
jgi:adenylate kinase family enzyme